MGINMQNEEEVQQYLNDLQLEYQFSCYRENNGEGCSLLGEFMTNARQDFTKAAAAFKKGCDKHDFPKACFKYGGFLYRGRAVKKDVSKALEYQKKACDLGWKEACVVAGGQHLEDGPHNDPVKAAAYFTRACDMGFDAGCAGASTIYYRGRGAVPQDAKKSLDFAVRACELFHAQSCANAAYMYKTGRGAEVDLQKSNEYREKARDMQQQMKRNRGFEMEQGIGAE